MRQKLPGSPFALNVVAANASASGSMLIGAEQMRELTAGERLELSIYFRDDFGNACAPPTQYISVDRVEYCSATGDARGTHAHGA